MNQVAFWADSQTCQVRSRLKYMTFVINDSDPDFFSQADVIRKLPTLKHVGGASRREGHLKFKRYLQKWNIE